MLNKNRPEMSKTAAIICAGGIGERMGAGMPKQFIQLDDGTSIIRKTVDAFRAFSASSACRKSSEDAGFDVIVVTSPSGYIEKTDALLNSGNAPDKAFVIEGGKERQDSVWNALCFLKDKGFEDDDIVLIHDGARPFVSQEIISVAVEAARENGAAITAVPVKDTIRDIKRGTLDRKDLFQVQTPQSFRFGLIYGAVKDAIRDGFYGTDDGSLVEREGTMPVIVPGSYSNIKITTPEDL